MKRILLAIIMLAAAAANAPAQCTFRNTAFHSG